MNDEAAPSTRNEESARRFIESFALVLTNAGMQRTSARMLAALLASDRGRLTAREIAQTLQVSPAAISGAARYLVQVNLVERIREPGQRADHFAVGDDPWYEAMLQENTTFDAMLESLPHGIEAVGSSSPAGKRLQETQRFFEFMRDEISHMVERWHAEHKPDGQR